MELKKTISKNDWLSTLSELKKSGRDFAQRTIYLCRPRGFNYFVIEDTHFFFVSKKEYEFLLTLQK